MTLRWKRHSRLTTDDLHSIVWTKAVDTAARLAVTVTANDVGKVLHQTDDNTYWILRDEAGPTWDEFTGGSGGGGAVSSVFTRTGDVAAVAGDYVASEVDNDSSVSGGTVSAALDALDAAKAGTSHAHTLSDINDSGTAAALNVGVATGDVVQLEDVGGSPGLPAVDGSQLTGIAGGGTGDHGGLTGLTDDDHPQYHTDTRGDLRYYTQGQVDTSLAGKADAVHTHAAADVTSGTFDAGRISSVSVTQHEGDIDHDALTNFVTQEHIRWDLSGAEQIDASRYASGTGGATNTVTGTSPVENTGDNVNAVLALESQAQSTLLGRAAGAGTGVPGVLTAAQSRTLLNVADGSVAEGATGDAYALSHEADTTAHAASELSNDSSVSGAKVSDALNTLSAAAPNTHNASHQNGGADEISVQALSGLLTDSQSVSIQDDGVGQGQAQTLNMSTGINVTVGGGVATITSTGGGGAVDSVFGRTGVVTAQSGDYSLSQVGSGTMAQLNTIISDTNVTVASTYIQAADPVASAVDGDFWIET